MRANRIPSCRLAVAHRLHQRSKSKNALYFARTSGTISLACPCSTARIRYWGTRSWAATSLMDWPRATLASSNRAANELIRIVVSVVNPRSCEYATNLGGSSSVSRRLNSCTSSSVRIWVFVLIFNCLLGCFGQSNVALTCGRDPCASKGRDRQVQGVVRPPPHATPFWLNSRYRFVCISN